MLQNPLVICNALKQKQRNGVESGTRQTTATTKPRVPRYPQPPIVLSVPAILGFFMIQLSRMVTTVLISRASSQTVLPQSAISVVFEA
jgi:hypothetical protein